ncbi:MAG TPA: hypothetical protein VFP40_05575, partial [Terriglobales bacterium]|nr:hypothetical protein [Terriglobales bacterium]
SPEQFASELFGAVVFQLFQPVVFWSKQLSVDGPLGALFAGAVELEWAFLFGFTRAVVFGKSSWTVSKTVRSSGHAFQSHAPI